VLTNPPWDIRLEGGEEAWRSLGQFLRRECGGARAWVLSGNKELTQHLHMRASSRLRIENDSMPTVLDKVKRRLVQLEVEREALKLEKDPDNLLLARGPRFRLTGEMLRDGALASAGLLSPKMGGPSVYPPQPGSVVELAYGNDAWKTSGGEDRYRRSLYTFSKRTAPFAAYLTFDGPTGENCLPRRDRTNTPLQALVTMNDPQFVEASRNLAQRALGVVKGDDNAKLHAISERLLCRPLKDQELAILQASLADLRAHYKASTADADALLKVGESKADDKLPKPELAAWTMVCNQLMNLEEVLNK
jgi:ATP-dependent Clp protease ATP-binding subunit ClpA